MNKYEAFRNGLLKRASQFTGVDNLFFTSSSGLSAEFGIPEPHVREQLLEFAAAGLMRLTAWDGIRERPYDEWPDGDSFFFNRSDGGYIRIRLLRAGGELVSELPKEPIGFVAPPN
jgi:hypothetical protein